MKKTIKYYAQLYRLFFTTNFAEASTYRLHFFLVIFMDLIFYASFYLSIDILYNHVDSIGGWSRNEFLFFTAFVMAIDQLHMTFVSESFWNLSYEIRTGKLDFVLLKPASHIFSIFFRFIRPSTLMNFPVAWGILIYFGLQVDLTWSQWILLPPMALMGFAIMVLIEMIVACGMFWMVEGTGINFLRMQFQEISRWPDFAYLYQARRLFTVGIPLLLIGSAPVHFIFDPANQWTYLAGALVALFVLWVVFRWLWRISLNSYESASS